MERNTERSDLILLSNLHDLKIQSDERLQLLIRSQKFKMFFAGLVFAITSLLMTSWY